jgi:prepilin-type processing-associated H-X9-DG protein
VLQCPSDAEVESGDVLYYDVTGWLAQRTSYAFSSAVSSWAENGAQADAKLNNISSPSSVGMFLDGQPRDVWGPVVGIWNTDTTWSRTFLDAWEWDGAGHPSVFDLERHRAATNVIYVDGHAKTHKIPSGLEEVGLSLGLR